MKETAVAHSYARALNLALQGKNRTLAQEVKGGLTALNKAITSSSKLHSVLNHPLISFEEKRKSVQDKITGGSSESKKLLSNFIDLLLSKKRIQLLPIILHKFSEELETAQGQMKAAVKSAYVMDEKAKKSLEKKLSDVFKKEVIINVSVDPDLIAGVLVKVGDQIIDGSYRSRLRRVHHLFNR